MTRQQELILQDKIDQAIYLNRKTLQRIKDLYILKSECKSLTYVICFCGKEYPTLELLLNEIRKMNVRYTLNLSQPFKPKWNTFVYYITLTKTIDYGDNLEDTFLRSLFSVRKEAHTKTRIPKIEIPKGWQYQKRN